MKNTKKLIALLLAFSFVFSVFGFNVFAEAIESPIIPIGPKPSEWFEYELDEEEKTAILTAFVPADGRTKITVRATYEKDDVEYAVVGVGKDAFKGTDIRTLTIEEGVKSIAEGAFENCASLSSVSFADSLEFVDETAFDGTAWLQNHPDGLIYAGKIAYKYKGTAPASIVFAADTASVAEGAFKNQTTLEKIFIPEATTIGADAFAGCTAVTFYCYENSPAAIYAAANEITVVTIPALVLKSVPTKTEYYQDDALNLNGIELVYLTEAGEASVEVTPEMVSGYNAATLGQQTVTVTYEGKTVQFQVNVSERPAFIPGDVDNDTVVDLDDAIYLLYHVNFKDTYPVQQPVDFNGDGKEDLDDAIYLLYHVNFKDTYPLH